MISLAACASYSHSVASESLLLAVGIRFCLIVCIRYEGESKETLIGLVMTELSYGLMAVWDTLNECYLLPIRSCQNTYNILLSHQYK